MKPTTPRIMIGGETPAHYEILLPLPVQREGWRVDTLGGIYQLSFDYKEHVIIIYSPNLAVQNDIVVIYHNTNLPKVVIEKSWITNDSRQGVADTINFLISAVMTGGLLKKPPAKSVKKNHYKIKPLTT